MNVIELFSGTDGTFKNTLRKKSVFLAVLFTSSLVYIFKDEYYKILILLVCTVILVDGYISLHSDSLEDTNKQTLLKLNQIQMKIYDYVDIDLKIKKIIPSPMDLAKLYESVKMNAMYMDATMISFIHSILPMYEYSPEQFYRMTKGTNTILNMLLDIERFFKANNAFPNNTSDMLKRSLEIKSNCLNNIQNFIYSIPKEEAMFRYHYKLINRYNKLITSTINKIYEYDTANRKLIGVSSSTKFSDYNPIYSTPSRNDETLNDKYFI
jgi:hypothetical protein